MSDQPDATAAAKTRQWQQLLEFDAKMNEHVGVRILTPEARILFGILCNGPLPVTTAISTAGTSYRGFYAVLERLKKAGLISTVRDDQDQRVRRLNLDPSIEIDKLTV